jgi:acyl carrier protein
MTTTAMPRDVSEREVRTWLIDHIARLVQLPPEQIDVTVPFAYYGLDSVQGVEVAMLLESWLGREVSPTAAYEFPTIELLAQHVATATPSREVVGL